MNDMDSWVADVMILLMIMTGSVLSLAGLIVSLPDVAFIGAFSCLMGFIFLYACYEVEEVEL